MEQKTSKLNPAILKKTSMIMQLVFMVVMRFELRKPFFGYDEFYFGKYSENKKISYAASFVQQEKI